MSRPRGNIFVGGYPQYEDVFWEDLRAASSFLKGGGNDPDLVQFLSGGYFYCFSTNDELGLNTQLPHARKAASDIELHLHWTPHSRGAAEGDAATVQWKVDLSIASINGTFPSVTTYTLTDTCDGVDNKHQLIGATVAVDGSSLGLSSVITGRVYKDGGTWVGTGVNGPMLLELDFHYQLDMPGSRQEYVK